MPFSLTRFAVIGLYGRKTINVPIEDNKLVLVGENGTSKSTFANFIYFFLTRQWSRLREYHFHAIQATLDTFEFEITPEKIEEFFTHRQHASFLLSRHLSQTSVSRFRLRRLLDEQPNDDSMSDEENIPRVAEELGLPPRRVREILFQYRKEVAEHPPELQSVSKRISSLTSGQFLYLPTYRRIEQDLKSIFRDVEMGSEVSKLRERLAARVASHFIELVHFGMEDVERTFTNRMSQTKESVRQGLDNLTGTYLKDVIRGDYDVDMGAVRSIDPQTLESMFARIDEATLPTRDKERLKQKVTDMAKTKDIDAQGKIIAHFLSKLVALYAEQQSNERDVRDFVKVCNEYLGGKEIVYDNTKYTMYVRLSASAGEQLEMNADPLQLKYLSSGEKQIVSLFSHVYLSGQESFFVVIDEPELSLSVPWQRRFLPDIAHSGLCSGIISVTHSPFIWENELEGYVRSIAEFTEPYCATTVLH